MGIHDAVLTHVLSALQASMIDDLLEGDDTAAGIVAIGPLQGQPAPDTARISVTVHENDPDRFFGGAATALNSDWSDEVALLETTKVVTWRRRFTVKARCLLVKTKENKADARRIASTVRTRIEDTLTGLSFTGVEAASGEYVSRGVISEAIKGEMVQSGGPPNSYDFHIKVRFDVLTTTRSLP